MNRLRNLAELDYASTIHPLARELRARQIRGARRLSLIDGQPILPADPTQQVILDQFKVIREQLAAA